MDLIKKYLGEAKIPTIDYSKVGADDWIIYDENTGEIQKIVKGSKRNINVEKHFVSSKSAGVKASYAATKLSWLFLKKNKGFSDLIKTVKNNESLDEAQAQKMKDVTVEMILQVNPKMGQKSEFRKALKNLLNARGASVMSLKAIKSIDGLV